jgi:hypothetical protein
VSARRIGVGGGIVAVEAPGAEAGGAGIRAGFLLAEDRAELLAGATAGPGPCTGVREAPGRFR